MNDEQIYDLFAGIRQINERFGRTANALEAIDDKIDETNDKIGELECIDRKLCAIWTQLERIANAVEKIATTYSDAEKKFGNLTSLTIKTDPADGPFCSQEPEEPEGFADME